MSITVMKFGGASVKDASSVVNVVEILLEYKNEPKIVVISAMGKMTNALEKLAHLAATGQEEAVVEQFEAICDFHLQIVDTLFGEVKHIVENAIQPYFDEIQKCVEGILLLGEFPSLMYDRIVAFGELISTKIVAAYIEWVTGDATWLDARSFIKTDMQYNQAQVLWGITGENIIKQVLPLIQPGKIVVTQGFIASTVAGKTTTLGREGSDYTAAILAYCLDASKVVIWKDVKGVLSADPKLNPQAVLLENLTYEEAVEMTYYGATVIHPKTIQPLYNKKIPLYVRSFIDTQEKGTCISTVKSQNRVSVYITKPNQLLVKVSSRDFSFMDENLVQTVFQKLYHSGIKINLCQTTTLSLILCIDNKAETQKNLESELSELFFVECTSGKTINTIINYNEENLSGAHNADVIQVVGKTLCVVK
ncbi:MAG: aspartate kinase [Bacteroidia bacterium]|nr:aspartate kinase [Bacteroidia bacterium]